MKPEKNLTDIKSETSNFKFKADKGFTLVEIIVSIALLSLILITVTTIFATTVKNFRIETQKSVSQKELNFVIDNITKDVKQAVEIPTDYDVFTLSDQVLILAIPTLDEDGKFIFAAGQMEKDYIIYYADSNNLKKKIIHNPLGTRISSESILLSNVSFINLTYAPANVGARQVEIAINLSETVGRANIYLKAERTANLRNKE